jgi:N-acetylmuramoyl-L-alanine amidase
MTKGIDNTEQTSGPSSSAEGTADGPAGSSNYEVRQGECMESVAYEQGFFWETLWKLPENAGLKQQRQDPNALLAGDKVYVPTKREKQESGGTEQRYRFRRRGVPSRLHIILKKADGVRANEPYVIEVDGNTFSGNTNDRGEIRRPVPPNARRCILRVGREPDVIAYDLSLGHIDPITAVTGVQGRLMNLGYDCGMIDGDLSPRTVAAIRAFQEKAGLQSTGQIDQATRDALQREHGS